MKKHLLILLMAAGTAASANAQLAPTEPATKQIYMLAGATCGSTTLRASYSWPTAGCLPGYFATSETVMINFYLERSVNGVNGWSQVATYGPQFGNTAHDFPVTTGGYYRCRANITYSASGGGGGCWNGTYNFNYLYTNILHVPINAPSASFNINGNAAASPTVIPGWLCNAPFILNNTTSSANVEQYGWSVVRVNSMGVPLTSPNDYSFTFPWTTGNPSSINLVTGTSNNILTPGYYQVTLRVKNSLCGTSTKNARLQVLATPSPATMSFQVLQNGGIPVAPSTNIAAPVMCGATSVTIQGITTGSGGWPAGSLSIRAQIREVDVLTGNALPTQPAAFTTLGMGMSSYQPLGSVSSSYNLNSLTAGYFTTQGQALTLNGRKFRVSFFILSPCGEVEYYTFIGFTGMWWEIVAPRDPDRTVRSGISVVSAYPNPVTERLNIALSEAPSSGVTYQLLDISGSVVASGRLPEAAQLQIGVELLAPGTYIYVLDVGGEQQRGRIVKQ